MVRGEFCGKINKFLTLDSISTSDNESDVLKIKTNMFVVSP